MTQELLCSKTYLSQQELRFRKDFATTLWLDEFYLRNSFTMEYVEAQISEQMVHVTPEYEQLMRQSQEDLHKL